VRATFYARVSTDKEEQKNSIAAQVEYFTTYIKDNNLIPVPHCGIFCKNNGDRESTDGYYVDEGLTASKSNYKNRQAFKQMINDAKARKFDIIYVKSISRFSRSLETTVRLIKDLKEIGIGVYFDDLKVNSLHGQNEMLIAMFAAMAQEESRNKSVNIQFGILRSMKNKKWTSTPPYGYDKINGYLVVNPFEAEIVKKIYKWYLEDGLGVVKIRNRLNKEKIPTKRRKAKWNSRTVAAILSNIIYTGLMIQHKTKKIDINRNIHEIIPEGERITHFIEELKLIEAVVYRCVQIEKQRRMEELGTFEYLGRKRLKDEDEDTKIETAIKTIVRKSGRHSSTHLLSNLFFCGHCGMSMRRKKTYWRKKMKNNTEIEWIWMCRNNDIYGKKSCAIRNTIYEKELIEMLRLKIDNFIVNTNLHNSFLEVLIKSNSLSDENLNKLVHLKEEFIELKKMRESNFKLYSKEKIDENEYEERNTKINEDLIEVTKQIESIENTEKELDILKLQYRDFINSLNSIDTDNLTNVVLKKFISRIFKYTEEDEKTRFEIEWKILGDSDANLLFDYALKA